MLFNHYKFILLQKSYFFGWMTCHVISNDLSFKYQFRLGFEENIWVSYLFLLMINNHICLLICLWPYHLILLMILYATYACELMCLFAYGEKIAYMLIGLHAWPSTISTHKNLVRTYDEHWTNVKIMFPVIIFTDIFMQRTFAMFVIFEHPSYLNWNKLEEIPRGN